MRPTPEELAAFADGELDEARAAEIAVLVDDDPALAREVARHRDLRAKLSAHFAPILDQPVPSRLSDAVRPRSTVVDFAAAKQRRKRLPRWSLYAAPALAACLVLAIFVGGRPDASTGYADRQLASVLDDQLVAGQGDEPTRILLSFRDGADRYCRAFSGAAKSGIACRDAQGWKLEAAGDGSAMQGGEYRQAGSDTAALMAAAQDMATGPALDAEEERRARGAGWMAR
ncbi:anti-sigma factor family protein [Croceicoccus bisphenolivorans]|uniref:anti-sigma factor family protein n=1 Tax=Croceicoccus bisphenolivorans TaxID=1783232 RepID=UPI00082982EA|nr:hypothetical protein [Croceicoccus bisphenolivorans]